MIPSSLELDHDGFPFLETFVRSVSGEKLGKSLVENRQNHHCNALQCIDRPDFGCCHDCVFCIFLFPSFLSALSLYLSFIFYKGFLLLTSGQNKGESESQ